MTPVAIFDRDATIIDIVRDEETGAITVAFHPSQLRLLPSVIEGMRALQDAGFVLGIATNQPGPAKGQVSAAAVHQTNLALVARLSEQGVRIGALEVCMHHPEGGPGGDPALVAPCACRKPKPGMLTALMARFDGDPARSWMVGDSVSDVEAGRAAGLKTALVFAYNRCELCPLRDPAPSQQAGARATASQPKTANANLGRSAAVPDVRGSSLLEVAREILRCT